MEKTLFVKMLGDSPKVRVLDALITGRELEYSITDIAEAANIGRSTFYALMDSLIKDEVITLSRKFGNIQLYKINLANEIIQLLINFYDKLISTQYKVSVAK